jgi:hypothetical protein
VGVQQCAHWWTPSHAKNLPSLKNISLNRVSFADSKYIYIIKNWRGSSGFLSSARTASAYIHRIDTRIRKWVIIIFVGKLIMLIPNIPIFLHESSLKLLHLAWLDAS